VLKDIPRASGNPYIHDMLKAVYKVSIAVDTRNRICFYWNAWITARYIDLGLLIVKLPRVTPHWAGVSESISSAGISDCLRSCRKTIDVSAANFLTRAGRYRPTLDANERTIIRFAKRVASKREHASSLFADRLCRTALFHFFSDCGWLSDKISWLV